MDRNEFIHLLNEYGFSREWIGELYAEDFCTSARIKKAEDKSTELFNRLVDAWDKQTEHNN